VSGFQVLNRVHRSGLVVHEALLSETQTLGADHPAPACVPSCHSTDETGAAPLTKPQPIVTPNCPVLSARENHALTASASPGPKVQSTSPFHGPTR
jgi:hypothetical protein